MHKIRAVSAQTLALGLCLASSALGYASNHSDLRKEVPGVIQRSLKLGHSDSKKLLHVSVSLPYGDAAGMQKFVDSVSNPRSPYYRHYITPDEVGQRFGLSEDKVQAVADYLKSQGFKINLVGKNRLSILAECTIAQAEAAFSTTINEYQTKDPHEPGHQNFFAFSTALKAPDAIAPYISDVSGLESFTKPHFQALTPDQARTLYNLAPMYNAGMQGQGRTVAISNWDGYRLTNVPLYYSHFGLPTPAGGVGSNVHKVSIGGRNGETAAVGAEGDLDIQMVLGMAPLCEFYIYDNAGASDLIGVLTREVNDNLADVISESYGWSVDTTTATSAHNLHLSMSAQGITYMCASGDSGTSIEPYSYPTWDGEVLMVGGTVATVDGSGNRSSEVGWSGSGGGWSNTNVPFNVRPSWQVGNGVPTNVNRRLSPDVGFHSAGPGAYQFYLNGSLSSGYIGTSFACPVVAGSLAVAEQQIIANGGLPANGAGKRRFGRIQDLIYSQNGRSDVWFDVTSGANGTLPDGSSSSAHAGWDYVTGWGAINWVGFVASQGGPPTPDFSINTTPASRTVTQGTGTTYSTATAALNGYSGTIALSVTGLPSGASGSFSPSSVAVGASSTLTVSTSAATPAGSYTLTVTGTDGTITHTNTVTLVVNAVAQPDFTFTVTPSSQTVVRGQAVYYSVAVTGQNGFGGVVTLSVTGLPSSSTATFTPATITATGTSTMKIQTSASTAKGAKTLTVRGVSGSLNHTFNVVIQVKQK